MTSYPQQVSWDRVLRLDILSLSPVLAVLLPLEQPSSFLIETPGVERFPGMRRSRQKSFPLGKDLLLLSRKSVIITYIAIHNTEHRRSRKDLSLCGFLFWLFSMTSGCFLGFSFILIALFVTFLACPRKVTQRRAPGENPIRHARSSAVHFGNSPEQGGGSGAQTVRNA